MVRIIPKSIFFFCFILLTLISSSQSRYLLNRCDRNNGNYTTNGTYETNLDDVVSSFASATNTTTSGFFSRSAGETPDTVNAIALCRGDVEPDACRSCINESIVMAKEVCPNGKGATVWYDDCMLRFSGESFLGNSDTNGGSIFTIDNIPNADELYQAMRPLMDRLRNEAAGGDSRRKFASDDTSGPDFMTIYGLMQCTPDLSEGQCYDCLERATNSIPGCCSASLDVRVLYPSCNVRYSGSRFYNASVVLPAIPAPPSPELLQPSQPSPPSQRKNSNTTLTVGIVVVSSLGFLIFVVSICIYIRNKKLTKTSLVNFDEDTDETITVESLKYGFDIMRRATNDFSENNKLGEGGFGAVYKGKLQNGQEIAVKQLSINSGQGEREFKNEVLLLAKLQHKNLVRLRGFSYERKERLLIYEFVQNASLDHFIFDPKKRAILDWVRRYKIIKGIARGLLYLHEDSRLKIIHRDLKASNILLDAEMNPKIADFGMARLFTPEETQCNTSQVVGTYGYMAPEYALHGEFSVKSDVFSFGVIVLEIITGHMNHSFRNGEVVEDLLSEVWKSWRDGAVSSVIDPTLEIGSVSLRDVIRCIHIGLLCVQENVSDRPTMASVILMLNSFSVTFPVPSEPAYFIE